MCIGAHARLNGKSRTSHSGDTRGRTHAAARGGPLAEREVVPGEIDQVGETVEREGRARKWPLLLLLLLLLLCAITTIVDTFVDRGPDRVRFVARNLECLQCHTELIPELSLASVHNPFLLEDCTVCHTPHGKEVERTLMSGSASTFQRIRTVVEWLPLRWILSAWDSVTGVTETDEDGRVISRTTEGVSGERSELTAPLDELCWICHGNLGPELGMPYQHAPFTNGKCLDCHNPHASEWSGLLTQDPRDLCMTCHGSIGAQMARSQLHPPVEGRHCTNCHLPHASEWKGILTQRQRDLCFMCHPSVAPLSRMAVQHQPFEYDNCTGCHEPHGSDYEPLLIDYEPRVCYLCHADIQDDFGKRSVHPVGTAQLNCSDCHNPHAAPYEGLLAARDNEMCYQCHRAAIQVSYDASDHGPLLCIRCHTPHGSDHEPILRDRNPDICLTCHGSVYAHDNQHPVSPEYLDVRSGTPLTCTSTCHGPHGTEYPMMVKFMPWPYDGRCLQCHSRVGIDF